MDADLMLTQKGQYHEDITGISRKMHKDFIKIGSKDCNSEGDN